MEIRITPVTQYNSFVSAPSGRYTISTCIGHQGYHPISNFEEREIDSVVKKLKELLEYFKGNHSIGVEKLVCCKPFELKNSFRREKVMRNWKIVSEGSEEVVVNSPKAATVSAYSGSSFGERGWFLKAVFDIEGIASHSFGILCSSYKSAKGEWEYRKQKDEEIAHWKFEKRKRTRRVKCNICKKVLDNLKAEQCSKCGRYFCGDCMAGGTCRDCEGMD